MSLTKKEEAILKSIFVASRNNPKKPEFPPQNPKFPATPTYKISVPNFSNVWIKDESVNETGTHKDRMAWEIIVAYKGFLNAKKNGVIKKLPALSIISSGSAAMAIQTQLKKYKLPNLHVLMDKKTDAKIVDGLKKVGCKIFLKDLDNQALDWQKILALTDNEDGFDITSNKAFFSNFYDWMSYEIVNANADFIFVPFGTGQLYENIMSVVKNELTNPRKDPRFLGKKKILQNASILGANTKNKNSKATKLYAPFLPFTDYSSQWIKFYRHTNLTGQLTQVYDVQEKFLDQAIELALAQKINCEPSAIASLGLLLQMQNKIPRDKKILIVSTGKSCGDFDL